VEEKLRKGVSYFFNLILSDPASKGKPPTRQEARQVPPAGRVPARAAGTDQKVINFVIDMNVAVGDRVDGLYATSNKVAAEA
jgi:hypothetical protein